MNKEYNDIIASALLILSIIDDAVDFLEDDMKDVQKSLEEYLLDALFFFQVRRGRLVNDQKFNSNVLEIERGINKILNGKKYQGSIEQYLNELNDVEESNINLQKTYNDLKVEVSKLTPARKYVFDTAKHYLLHDGLQEGFVQPVKFLIMQQVTSGASIADSKKLIHKWANGQLTKPTELTMGRQTPNLQNYSTHIARDSAYQFNGIINQVIADEYELDTFIYVGNLIEDSRPLCRHLVDLDRPIKFSELPPLIEKYPTGLIKNTTTKNFIVYRGGYNCRHSVTPIKV